MWVRQVQILMNKTLRPEISETGIIFAAVLYGAQANFKSVEAPDVHCHAFDQSDVTKS